jgi:hypothetical protein
MDADQGSVEFGMPAPDPFGEVTERNSFRDYIPPFFRKGSEFWRWVSMVALNTTTMLGIGLLVIGTGLVGGGVAILASGFGVIDVALTADLGSSLAVGLVVSLLGAFATGLAVEGPVGYKVRRFEAKAWEAALTALPAFLIAAWLAAVLGDLADRFLLQYSEAFIVVPELIKAVGKVAIGWPMLVAVAAVFTTHQFVVGRFAKLEYQVHGIVYVVWLLATVSAYSLFN